MGTQGNAPLLSHNRSRAFIVALNYVSTTHPRRCSGFHRVLKVLRTSRLVSIECATHSPALCWLHPQRSLEKTSETATMAMFPQFGAIPGAPAASGSAVSAVDWTLSYASIVIGAVMTWLGLCNRNIFEGCFPLACRSLHPSLCSSPRLRPYGQQQQSAVDRHLPL